MMDNLDQEFHELFFVPEVPKKSRFTDRSRLKTRVSKNHPEHYRYYKLKSFAEAVSGKQKEKKSSSKSSSKSQPPTSGAQAVSDPPILELNSNPSRFKIFATIRQAVIENKLRNDSLIFVRSLQGLNNCDDANEDSDQDDSSKDSPIKVPKVVALGLCVVFELIRESRYSNPGLCSRALQALLDSLQGQVPEGLKKEPPDVTNGLFDLLLDLSITSSDTKDNSSSSTEQVDPMVVMMRSFACSSLLSLAISMGETGKILKAINCLLTSSSSNNNFKLEQIETPSILISSQRSIQAVILGKTSRPEWLTHGFPASSFCDSFQFSPSLSSSVIEQPGDPILKLKNEQNDQSDEEVNNSGVTSEIKHSSLVFDGKYLYLLNHQNVLYKIGSGFGGTQKGQVIISKRMCNYFRKKSQAQGWIGWIQGYLYFQSNNWTSNELIKLDCETLTEVARITLGISSWCPSLAAADGDFLLLISTVKDDGFILRTLKPSTSSPSSANEIYPSSDSSSSQLPTYLMPVVQEVPLKLAHKCLVVCGGSSSSTVASLFDASPSLTSLDQQSANQTSELVSDSNKQFKLKQIQATDEDIAQVCSGKDFALIRTASGKVLYSGRSQSLGIKHGSSSSFGRWTTLPISKSPKITSMSVGHEAAHVLLVSEDGSVYFCGVSKRGEDGDQGRGSSRRQPKAMKPRKIARMDGKTVVSCSSNYGTSALITKDGELYMFGKDTSHVDRSSGLVSSLKKVTVTSVSLGKAHGLALTNKGLVYSFGLNHKGQCGHDFSHLSTAQQPSTLSTVSSGTLIESASSDAAAGGTSDSAVDITEDLSEPVCPAGNHRWIYEQCMICTSCGNCTGYGVACVARMKSEVRNPGLPCGCGVGDSGCVDCGMCKTCDKLSKDSMAVIVDDPRGEEAVAVAIPVIAANGAPVNMAPFNIEAAALQGFDRDFAMIERPLNEGRRRHPAQFQDANNIINPRDVAESALRAAIIASEAAADIRNVHVPGGQYFKQVWRRNAIEAYLGRKFRHLGRSYRNEHRPVDNMGHAELPAAERLNPIVPSSSQLSGNNYLHHQLDEASTGSDCETTKLTSIPPTKLNLNSKVVQISCGIHHSVLLTEFGEVYTFGTNQQGQLGLGDFVMRDMPSKVSVPNNESIVQIAAGSNHTVLLSASGHVFTFGSNQKGQLARLPSAIDYNWNSAPHQVPNIGPKFGRRATWIEASGDHTFIKFDESLINPLTLNSVKVIADSKCVVLSPSSNSAKKLFTPQSSVEDETIPESSPSQHIKSLVINRSDGSCRVFSDPDQIDLSAFSANCLDDFYDTLWSFDSANNTFHRHNIIAVESKQIQLLDPHNPISNDTFPLILSPEIVVPNKSGFTISRSNAALNLLCSLHTLTCANSLGMTVFDDDPVKNQVAKTYSKEDFSSVNRFESHGGGWGYSGHSIEAIRFSCDADVLLGGLGLFGGRGEYLAKLRIYDIGMEGGDQEGDGEIIAETEETPFECGSRQKYPVIFEEPVHISANRWYVAWARVSGPSSDCGSSGQSLVNTDDQVTFYFKSSKKSNNGTDVNAGQIPLILYKLISPGESTSSHSNAGFVNKNSVPCTNPVTVLSRSFSMAVSVECFTSLLNLLKWSWSSFKVLYLESPLTRPAASSALESDLKHLSYICCAALYLLKIYVNEVFPSMNKKLSSSFYSSDISKIAESVGDTRTLIKSILMDAKPSATSAAALAINNNDHGPSLANILMSQILVECQGAFTSCYHAFYPSANLRWRGLCDLLLPDGSSTIDEEPERANEHFLSAMFASLSSPMIRLTLTFPINMDSSSSLLLSPTLDIASPTGSVDSVTVQDPILVEKMTEKSDREECHSGTNCNFGDILNKLLMIVGQPVESLIVSQQRLELEKLEDSLEGEPLAPLSPQLVANTCSLLSSVVSELVAQSTGLGLDFQLPVGQSFQITPSRFSRVSQNRTWNTGNGTPDAISFTVDKSGILIAGVTVYGGTGNEWNYELEILEYNDSPDSCQSQNLQYSSIDAVRGTYSSDEKNSSDVTEIKFERPIPVRENVKYALRLRNYGARTNNGDGGLTRVQGPDGTTFTFSDCPLSFNGTNHTRGQIPQILYYSSPPSLRSTNDHKKLGDEIHARRSVLSISEAVIGLAVELLKEAQDFLDHKTLDAISSSRLISKLLPSILASLVPVASNDPESVFQIMTLIRKILPLVVKLNKFLENQPSIDQQENVLDEEPSMTESNCLVRGSATTTSNHYVVVESDHPYKPASVYHYQVSFPSQVKWMSIEFDPKCGTAQQEDSLQLYVPSRKSKNNHQTSGSVSEVSSMNESDHWPVLPRYKGPPISRLASSPSENNVGNGNWPSKLLILPGNQLIFSLETASDYIKDDRSSFFGFKCQVIGYESPLEELNGGMKLLEEELVHLGVTCLTSLLSRNLILPPSSFPETDSLIEDEEVAKKFKNQSASRSSQSGTTGQTSSLFDSLNDTSLFSSVERCIFKDESTSEVGKLAQWLQLESQIDTNQCELEIKPSVGDHVKCGQPVDITVTIKDQFGEPVTSAQSKLQLSVQQYFTHYLMNEKSVDGRSGNQHNENVPACIPSPQTRPYVVSVKEKLRYHAITLMQPYEKYSFEELRYLTPVPKPSGLEVIPLSGDSNGILSTTWIPSSPGWFQVKADVNGQSASTIRNVHVIGEDVSPSAVIDQPIAPVVPTTRSKCRRFVVRESAGLRVRSLPSLQSEQIGSIPFNEDITFIDETENDDGTWVRLSSDSIRKFCPQSHSSLPTEAWCLQFNQHIGRPLLVAIENVQDNAQSHKAVSDADQRLSIPLITTSVPSPKSASKQSSSISIKLPCLYHVIKCGPAGHNIRSRSTVRSPAVGKLSLGNTLTVVQELKNIDGVWLKLSEESKKCYCYDIDGDAWALASIDTGVKYLQSEAEMIATDQSESLSKAENRLVSCKSLDEKDDIIVKDRFNRDPSSDLSLISEQQENVFDASSVTADPLSPDLSMITNGETIPSSPVMSHKSSSAKSKVTNKRPATTNTGSIKYPCVYRVMKCGQSGHNIRSKPLLRSPVVGQLVLGSTVTVVQELKNIDGVWLKLSDESKKSFCYSTDGDAWTLASIDLESEAARRTYALQALAWLLKNVTQPVALHDIMWSFVSALSLRASPSNSNQSVQNQMNQNQASGLESIKENGFPNEGKSINRDSITMIDHSIMDESAVVLRRDSNIRNITHSSAVNLSEQSENLYQSYGGVCFHPCSDLNAAGDSVRAVRQSFHSFLEAVSALMPILPASSPLQQIAMKCFYLHFEPADHAFLHRCHVFSNISKILSKSEEEQSSSTLTDSDYLSKFGSPSKSKLSGDKQECEGEAASIEVLSDITLQLDIKSSSRQAMIGSLTDFSTETFWESGDEDRNKTKVITISINPAQNPNLQMGIVYIHIDNCRDLGSKISHVCFKCSSSSSPELVPQASFSNIAEAVGPSKSSPVDPRPSASLENSVPLPPIPSKEPHSKKIKSVDVDNRFSGWLSCKLPASQAVGSESGPIRSLRIEMKGPDNTLRLRQVKVLGIEYGPPLDKEKKQPQSATSTLSRKTARNVGVCNYSQIQQLNCEAETLKVFRLLTSQVFGKLITGEEDSCSRRESAVIAAANQQTASLSSTGAEFGSTSSQENLNESRKASTSSMGGNNCEESNDLREHMVGILFSRSSKLSHLQKQICSHIVQAIRVEADRVREEWESLLCSPPAASGSGGSVQTFLSGQSSATSPASKNENVSPRINPSQIPSDAYCFEMLSMVLALSGSTIGRQYLSQQSGLVLDLFSLLHTGSARVQRQVTALLRRVLPEIAPSSLASLLKVKRLPPVDFMKSVSCSQEEPFDPHDSGILDVFLACIAKALTVQTKVKGGVSVRIGAGSNIPSSKSIMTITLATAIHPRDNLRDRWWLRGCMSRKLAEVIMTLVRDMSSGKLSETWASVTRGAISENIINLTRLPESLRSSNECLKTPTLWLALASLCVLDQEHAERLSSSSRWLRTNQPSTNSSSQLPSSGTDQTTTGPASNQLPLSQPSRPFCDNHDDNETLAIILCTVCGNLCAECDRFLHLHRKTKTHQRQIFKEEEEAIKVDLHEGCGRTKLFWLMALADSRQLKAMVEFRSSASLTSQSYHMNHRNKAVGGSGSGSLAYPSSMTCITSNTEGGLLLSSPSSSLTGLLGTMMTGICRFCGTTGNAGLLAIGNVCGEMECQEYSKTACSKILPCGHVCGGIRDETSCLPCLHGCDLENSSLKQDADDMCMICFTEALSAAPAIGLKCGHVFHLHCCQAVIDKQWPGPRITFSFSLCPICKDLIDHPILEELLKPIRLLYEDVKKKARMRLEYEGLHRSDAITSPGGRFFSDPAGYAMERYAYYVCSKCNKAYYGGEARCDAEAGIGDDYDPNELVCGGCSDVSRAQMCPKHGTDFLEYKCRYCCSVAVFFCFGTTHFCNPCHDDFQRVTNISKADLPKCPVAPRARQLEGSECPLHVTHPPTGEEFALGCGVCRNAHTF